MAEPREIPMIKPLKEGGKRFSLAFRAQKEDGENSEAEDFALGLPWRRRRALLAYPEGVAYFGTTMSRRVLTKAVSRLAYIATPPEDCSIHQKHWSDYVEGELGVDEQRRERVKVLVENLNRVLEMGHQEQAIVEDHNDQPVIE